MAEDSALKISALLAGGAGLFGAGVALGRGKSRPDASVSLSIRDSAAVELLVKGGRFRRERPGVFVVDFDGAQYRVARAVSAAVVKLGGLHFERAHWLAVTGMLEAAWLVLDAVPASRSVDPIRRVREERAWARLPPPGLLARPPVALALAGWIAVGIKPSPADPARPRPGHDRLRPLPRSRRSRVV